MRILSENETALLIGDMSKINLPDGVELYLSLGISQMFKRISNSNTTEIERDWLYIPLETLDILMQKINNVPSSSVDYFDRIDPIACDDQYLFPIYANQEIDLILVSGTSKIETIDRATLKCLVNTYVVYQEKNKKYGDSHDLFLENFAENNDSILHFIKSILNLLVKEIPRSCAGYYSDEENGLYRRMIVGDLGKFDLIPPSHTNEVKSKWNKVITRNAFFMPATSVENEVQFLVDPPDFIFVHNGLKSSCSENFISVLLPGNSDFLAIHFLKTIAAMTGKLSETQFLKSVSILDYVNENLHDIDTEKSTFNLLEKLFTLLNKQLRVTRLLFVEDDTAAEISFSKDGAYKTNESISLKLKDELINKLDDSNKYIIKDISEENSYEVITGQGQADVQSEIFCSIVLPDGSNGYLIIGSPKNKEVLTFFLQFILDAINAFVKCFSCKILLTELDETRFNQKILNSRFQLVGKLSTGYFHQIFSKMTVLLGKTEHLKKNIKLNKNFGDFTEVLKYISAIEENTDQIGEIVSSLHTLIPNLDGYYHRKIESAEMMKKIPRYLNGYLHYTSITRNISIRIDNLTRVKSGFLISGSDIDDVVIPIIISIVEESVKNGSITVEANKEFGNEFINISFHQSLVDEKDITSIILTPFKQYDIQINDSEGFKFGSYIISNSIKGDSMVIVKFRFMQESLLSTNNNKGSKKGVLERV